MTDTSMLFVVGCLLLLIGLALVGAWLGGPLLAFGLPALIGGGMLASGSVLAHLNTVRDGAAEPANDDRAA